MIDLTRQTECTGCGACVNICPKNALRLLPDESGFLYPQVDPQACVDCSLCNGVCQIEHPSGENIAEQAFYGLINKNDAHLKAASSGGAFPALAEEIFARGGVVVGCAFDEEHKAVHTVTHSQEACIQKLCGSKYVQSEMGDIYAQVKKLLSQGRLVLFTGTPCQVEGLLLFLKHKPDNLITVDLICHGVSSPLLWSQHKEHLEQKAGGKLQGYRFRAKITPDLSPYHYSYRINKKRIQGPALLDRYYADFLKGVNLRESCYRCQFSNLHRVSDLTIGDFWGAEACLPGLDLRQGVSLVIVNSPLGRELLQAIADRITLKEVSKEDAVTGNHNLSSPTARPVSREDYYERCFSDFEGWEASYVATKSWKLAKLKSRIPAPIKRLLRR